VLVSASVGDNADKAVKMINDLVNPVPLEIGQEFDGKVVKITEFGAFVNIMPGKDGLVHISKLGGGKRIAKVTDVLSEGDHLRVRLTEVRPDGKLNLTPVEDVPVGAGVGSDGDSSD